MPTKCKGKTCGREVLWVVNQNEKTLPVVELKTLYRATKLDAQGVVVDVEAFKPRARVFMSHYIDCPDARSFSRHRRSQGEETSDA